MKLRFLTLSVISALLALPLTLAQDAKKDDSTELETQMGKMRTAFSALGKQISDATKNDDSLAKVATLKTAATAALKLEPKKKDDIPAADQAKFVADYQAKMKEFIAIVDKLEAALKAGDNVAAAKVLDDMKAAQADDHKAFKKGKKKAA